MNYILSSHPEQCDPSTRMINPSTGNWCAVAGMHTAFIHGMSAKEANDYADMLQQRGEIAYVVSRSQLLRLRNEIS